MLAVHSIAILTKAEIESNNNKKLEKKNKRNKNERIKSTLTYEQCLWLELIPSVS
jgi:hypothetical protein